MESARSATAILDHDFLKTRGKLLELAAALDRVDRAAGSEQESVDPRHARCLEAIEILRGDGPNRAERVQRLFSDDYREGWRRDLESIPRA